jgi:hypothetical protein
MIADVFQTLSSGSVGFFFPFHGAEFLLTPSIFGSHTAETSNQDRGGSLVPILCRPI